VELYLHQLAALQPPAQVLLSIPYIFPLLEKWVEYVTRWIVDRKENAILVEIVYA
jgi:hypothetical protein